MKLQLIEDAIGRVFLDRPRTEDKRARSIPTTWRVHPYSIEYFKPGFFDE